MRTSFFRIAGVSVALSAAVACAASGEEQTETTSLLEDGGLGPIADAEVPDAADAAVPTDVVTAPSTCSDAGWCLTPLPDPEMTMTDIWPVDGHAFGLVETAVVEWDATVGHWVYIDDGSTRDLPNAVLANIWAPSKDEVYFTALARSPKVAASAFSAYLFHGTRAAPPDQGWTWTQIDFGCAANGAPQVWGTGPDDVYVWACKTVHHLDRNGSADAGIEADADAASPSRWVPEYVDDDLDPFNPLETLGITGAGPDDVWFVGVRGALWILGGGCTVVVHKSAAGYQRIVDGEAGLFTTDCTEKPGTTMLKGALTNVVGGGTLQSSGNGRAIGTLWTLEDENDLVEIEATGAGGSVVTVAKRPGVKMGGAWAASNDPVWILADRNGVGGIVRGTNVWSDAGTYEISTLVRDGVPNVDALWRLRGSANALWAAGKGHAYRKTLP